MRMFVYVNKNSGQMGRLISSEIQYFSRDIEGNVMIHASGFPFPVSQLMVFAATYGDPDPYIKQYDWDNDTNYLNNMINEDTRN